MGAGLAAVATTGGVLASRPPVAGAATAGGHPNGVSKARPRRGGTLVFGTEAEEEGFSPTQSTFDATGILYCRTVFDPLAIIAANGTVQPYLAQSITPNADYTSWAITLRPGVVFHNGAPCDGAALLANFNAQKGSLLTGQELTSVTSITQTGPLQVTVTMNAPWVSFAFYLAGGIGGQLAWIAEPTWLASGSQTHPVGTGPFVFQEWIPNDHFTATRNLHYWRPGLPYLDSITFKPIPDADQLLSSLKSGSVDILHTSVANVTASMRADSSLAYIDDSTKVAGEPDMDCVLLNLQAKPFDNLKVRQAAAMALRRRHVLQGHHRRGRAALERTVREGHAVLRQDRLPRAEHGQGRETGQAGATPDGQAGELRHRPHPGCLDHPGGRVRPTADPGGRHAGHPYAHPAGPADQHRPHRQVPGPDVAAVRGRRPRPQLHLLEPDQHQLGLLHQHGPQQRPEDAGRPA